MVSHGGTNKEALLQWKGRLFSINTALHSVLASVVATTAHACASLLTRRGLLMMHSDNDVIARLQVHNPCFWKRTSSCCCPLDSLLDNVLARGATGEGAALLGGCTKRFPGF